MLERIDAGVGLVMETLQKTGLDKSTLVIFSSDNGAPGKVGNNGKQLLDDWKKEVNAEEADLTATNGKAE